MLFFMFVYFDCLVCVWVVMGLVGVDVLLLLVGFDLLWFMGYMVMLLECLMMLVVFC